MQRDALGQPANAARGNEPARGQMNRHVQTSRQGRMAARANEPRPNEPNRPNAKRTIRISRPDPTNLREPMNPTTRLIRMRRNVRNEPARANEPSNVPRPNAPRSAPGSTGSLGAAWASEAPRPEPQNAPRPNAPEQRRQEQAQPSRQDAPRPQHPLVGGTCRRSRVAGRCKTRRTSSGRGNSRVPQPRPQPQGATSAAGTPGAIRSGNSGSGKECSAATGAVWRWSGKTIRNHNRLGNTVSFNSPRHSSAGLFHFCGRSSGAAATAQPKRDARPPADEAWEAPLRPRSDAFRPSYPSRVVVLAVKIVGSQYLWIFPGTHRIWLGETRSALASLQKMPRT